jgi:PAS domain S-box-containing protein
MDRERVRDDPEASHASAGAPAQLLACALDSLPASTAVLDSDGTIISVNECWTEFALANCRPRSLAGTGVGVNYLEVCRRAAAHDASAQTALEGIEKVLGGEQASFTLEYPCHSPHQQRWFMLFAARLKGEAGAVITHFDITARRLLEGELRRTQGLLQSILDHTPALVFVKDLQQRYLLVNRRCEEVLGVRNDEIRGKTAAEVFGAEMAHQFAKHDDHTIAADEPHLVEETVPMPEGAMTVASTQFPIRDGSGRTVAIGGVSVDITARKEAEARQATLVGELNHRIKNLLAVIQSIARNTFSSDKRGVEAYEEFAGRLHALARAQDLAIASKQGAEVGQLLTSALAGFADRVSLDGPDIATKASFAQMLALVVHELATNAVKYGALSSAEGRVAVRWAILSGSGGLGFSFSWRESGGPQVRPPATTSFGMRLIRSALSSADGEPVLAFDPEGFRYEVVVALAEVVERG